MSGARLVKWYNGSFVMISWGFDSLSGHHTHHVIEAVLRISLGRTRQLTEMVYPVVYPNDVTQILIVSSIGEMCI